MRENDNLGIIILVGILATAVIMFMIYMFSTRIGPTPEDYTIIPRVDALNGTESQSSYSP